MNFHNKPAHFSMKSFPAQPNFVGKVKSLPQSGALERCFTRVGSGLTHKHQAWLVWLARRKHSSLLRKFVTYVPKNFYSIGLCIIRIMIVNYAYRVVSESCHNLECPLQSLIMLLESSVIFLGNIYNTDISNAYSISHISLCKSL